jgi:aryl-alcohol dehydrogenase-like predicted oxidoreductase
VHLRMLEMAAERGFRFETVQMPLNLMDAHFRSFAQQVVPDLVKQQIGILGMKPLASGAILQSKTVSATQCLHYAMNLPTSVVITGIDSMQILQQALDAVKSFQPLTADERTSLLSKTQLAAADGRYERFKTSNAFDGTAQNPKWLGEDDKKKS